jgi:hypothetical protein
MNTTEEDKKLAEASKLLWEQALKRITEGNKLTDTQVAKLVLEGSLTMNFYLSDNGILTMREVAPPMAPPAPMPPSPPRRMYDPNLVDKLIEDRD